MTHHDKPALSLEFFPPREPSSQERLVRVAKQLLAMHPSYVSVTFGAGGSTRDGTADTVALLRNLGEHARLYMAYWEGKPLAGAIAIQYGDKTWYLYGASSGQHRDKMPNYLLQWEMIRWALAGGCRLYDFRGVSGGYGENRPIEGLYRFKAGFRGELVELMEEQDLVLRPASYCLMRAALALRGMLHRREPTHKV